MSSGGGRRSFRGSRVLSTERVSLTLYSELLRQSNLGLTEEPGQCFPGFAGFVANRARGAQTVCSALGAN